MVVGDVQFVGQVGALAAHHASTFLTAVGNWAFGAPDEPPSGGSGQPQTNKQGTPWPAGITSNADFGTMIGWGSGVDGAVARIDDITAAEVEQMEKNGLTADIAKAWRDFYQSEASRNATAAARAKLMDKIYDIIVAG